MRARDLAAGLTLAAAAACNVNTGGEPRTPATGPSVTSPAPSESTTARATAGGVSGPPRLVSIGRFANPLYVVSPPGDQRLFVVEQGGVVRVVRGGRTLPTPFLDISDETRAGGERGLLSIAFAPDYTQSGKVYVDFTDNDGDTRVVEYAVDGSDPDRLDESTRRELLRVDQPYANHNGGLLLFDAGGMLLVGLGDGGSGGDPEDRAQDLGDLLGKILRIDPRPSGGRPYGIPRDNPFVGRRGARAEIWAYGLRNPWRFSFDAAGTFWLGDVGQNRVEEVNAVPPARQRGANYGWPIFEGDEGFKNRPLTEAGPLIKPLFNYRNGTNGRCSVTAGGVYAGSAATLRGAFLYGDYCSGEIWAVRPRADGSVRSPQRLPFSAPGLASFGTDSAGEMYVVSLGGDVWRIAGGR